MPPGALQKQVRKLAEKIDGRDVYARDLVNDDMDENDELGDDYAELARLKADLRVQIKEEDDDDARKQLRAQVRDLSREQRVLDVRMLDLYVEDKDGERFGEETLAKTPVRVQTALINQAAKLIYGDEDPTPGSSDGR